jgi:hypothetical protein
MLASRPVRAALIVAWLLVILRSLVYAVFEHAYFDSDQAIVGLMAKHASEGRAAPLFFYGQAYMLAVESWIAVPFFWMGGATVAALRASLIATNLAVVTLLVVGLMRGVGPRPVAALAAAAWFALAPPRTAADLVEAQGGNIEPFLWVLLAWLVRARPFWLGGVLALGFLNREFTIYAVPVVAAAEGAAAWRRLATVRRWLVTLVVFLAVWQGVQLFKPLADLRGPGTRGSLLGGHPGSQIANLTDRVRIDVAGAPARVASLVTRDVADLLGVRRVQSPLASQGRDWLGWLVGLLAVLALARLARLIWRDRAAASRAAFAWYLVGVGTVAIGAYALTRPGDDVTRRYLLLAIFVPVGVTAAWLAAEPSRHLRRLALGVVVVWASVSAVDHARQWTRYARGPGQPNDMRLLVDALEARGLTVVAASYQRAYKIAFLSGERVVASSIDFPRIDAYELRARDEGAALVRVQDAPCPSGERDEIVGPWHLCRSGGPGRPD